LFINPSLTLTAGGFMAFENLYRWAPGYEPEWVLEARKEASKRRMEYAKARRMKAEATALDMARQIEGDLTAADFARIGVAAGLGPWVLRRVLEDAGHSVAEWYAGYPTTWPKWACEYVASWINEHVKPGAYGDEWLSMDDCCIALMKAEHDLEELLTNRSVRMALEAHGFKTVRRANGRGIVGYCIKR
jgi:hypothetical protein